VELAALVGSGQMDQETRKLEMVEMEATEALRPRLLCIAVMFPR
jgi:hypothetical protein